MKKPATGYMIIAVLAAWFAIAASMPAAAQAPSREKTQAAYELALKCFVANGHAYSNRRDAHDKERETYFNSKARHSWDVALRLSKQLGFSSARFDSDVDKATNKELPLMVTDADYFSQAVDQCKAYGLM